jgi:ADP-heptose:LPS heptosyltransferase
VGYARKWGFLLTKKMPDRKASAHRHEIDMNLELASLASDRTWDGRLELPVDDLARREIRALFLRDLPGGGPVVALHAGTSNPKKRWDEAHFAEICRRLKAEGFGVVLIGGPEEKETSSRIASASGAAPADWTGAFSLAGLAAFFAEPRVRALVSADSGPVHVAWISGVPVAALYAQDVEGSDPVRWGPRDKKSVTIHKPMAGVTVDEVHAALKKVLAA